MAKSIYALIAEDRMGGQVKKMRNKLRDIVCPNEKQREALERQAEKIIQESLINREAIRFVHKKGVLYISKPFQGFIGDCTSCKHFYDPGGITEGGDCLKHGISCGWGFTCRDNTSEYSVDILNKKKGCKND